MKDKPIWTRWWFWLAIVVIIAAFGNGGTEQRQTVAKPALPATSAPIEVEKPSAQEEFETRFADNYGSGIEDKTTFDPQDRDGDLYRTEFRLGAYSASTGVYGQIAPGMSISMVTYGGYGNPEKNTLFRVYMTGPREAVVAAYPALAKAMDPGLSDADIQKSIDSIGKTTMTLHFADSATRITSDNLDCIGDSCEAFIDIDTRQ